MTAHLAPYLTVLGNAREAMEFYRDAVGGELRITTTGEMGVELPGHGPDTVMHADLTLPGGMRLYAADDCADTGTSAQGVAVSLFGEAADAQRLTGWFDRLGEGGTVQMPMAPQMWGDTFGSLVDRFGVVWMVNIAGLPDA